MGRMATTMSDGEVYSAVRTQDDGEHDDVSELYSPVGEGHTRDVSLLRIFTLCACNFGISAAWSLEVSVHQLLGKREREPALCIMR